MNRGLVWIVRAQTLRIEQDGAEQRCFLSEEGIAGWHREHLLPVHIPPAEGDARSPCSSSPSSQGAGLSPAQHQQDGGLCQPLRAQQEQPRSPGMCQLRPGPQSGGSASAETDRGGNLKINNCSCRSLELTGSTEWEKPFFLCNAGGAAGNPQFTSHRSCCFGMEQLLLGVCVHQLH